MQRRTRGVWRGWGLTSGSACWSAARGRRRRAPPSPTCESTAATPTSPSSSPPSSPATPPATLSSSLSTTTSLCLARTASCHRLTQPHCVWAGSWSQRWPPSPSTEQSTCCLRGLLGTSDRDRGGDGYARSRMSRVERAVTWTGMRSVSKGFGCCRWPLKPLCLEEVVNVYRHRKCHPNAVILPT